MLIKQNNEQAGVLIVLKEYFWIFIAYPTIPYMLQFTHTQLDKLSVHHVGNQTNDEGLYLSKALTDVNDDRLEELLLRFFLSSFTTPEFYSFTFSNEDFRLNPLYHFAEEIFDQGSSFHLQSVNLAKHLYELSTHPQIKSGDLFVVYFSNVTYGEEAHDAIGIFKSESRQAFLKLDQHSDDFVLRHEDGINIDKLDKGCLIINTEKDSGYRVCVVDKSNRSAEAQYWKDTFLQLKACRDEYHLTKEFLGITKNFVTQQLSEEFEVSKADQIDLLNRSVAYFKTHDTFDKQEFEEEVFQDNGLIKSAAAAGV